MKTAAIVIAIASLSCALPATAQNPCASFRTVGNQNEVRYDPYGGAVVTIFNVQITSQASGAALVRFLLIDDDAAQMGAAGLGPDGPRLYQLGYSGSPDRGFGLAADQPNNLNSATGTLSSSGVDIVPFQMTIAAGQQARAGRHAQELAVRYQCFTADGTPIGMTNEQSVRLEVIAVVPGMVSADVAGSSRGEIDFGTISAETGVLTRSLDVTARATVPYEVSVATTNGSLLKRGPSDSRGIKYGMTYGNVAVTAGSRVVCAQPPAPASRPDTLAIILDARDVGAAPAGPYADTITLTFMPRDVLDPGGQCTLQP